jgi:hypothetical protein
VGIPTIVLSDVFGCTPAFRELAGALNADKLISPYSDNIYFTDENQAYTYFVEHLGLDQYLNAVKQELSAHSLVNIVGFSVGASVLWRLTAGPLASRINTAIGVYGSQIRHYLTNRPQCPIHLLLPRVEAHFDLDQMSRSLVVFEQVTIHQTQYKHGFMNQYSTNFTQAGYQMYLAQICDMLRPTNTHE